MPDRRRLVIAGMLFLALVSGCARTGSNHTSCTSTSVSPSTQPGGPTARKALDAFLKIDQTGLPKSGYTVEGHMGGRYIFTKGDRKISVTELPTSKGQKPVWVVNLTYDCE